jgi:hypothetical protein
MIIKNKKTSVERSVTVEQWDAIKDCEDMRNRFIVVDGGMETAIMSKDAEKIKITTAEIINFIEKKKLKPTKKVKK